MNNRGPWPFQGTSGRPGIRFAAAASVTRLLQRSFPWVAALLLAAACVVGSQSPAQAHAELIESDPPADGLAVSSPDQLTMRFTEEVVISNPAPVITLLDQQGNTIGASPLPLLESGDPRSLRIDIPDLDRGTFTVSWTVTSATDGHTLSGTYAFRVGGGLPPGQATSESETPAPWAVATRWITFLGASVAIGLLLFGEVLVNNQHAGTGWRKLRSRLILGGALVALAATLAEPLLQWLVGDNTGSPGFGDTLDALPNGWWWRPAMLVPLSALAVAIVRPMRGAIPLAIAWIGGLLGLGSLLGLIMTSHAAGRADYRWLAIGSDAVHQWSVALWTGGLVALVTWGLTRSGEDGTATIRLKRFSSAALILFAVAVISGAINTGFVFPFVQGIRDDGVSLDVFEPLWTSNYGVILLVKILVLLVPLGLAIYHRSLVTRLATQAADLAGSLPGRFRQTLRWELAAVAVVILGGSTIALSSPPPANVDTSLDRITLVATTTTSPEPESMVVHLTIDPAQVGDNSIEVRLTDWDGAPIVTDPAPRITLSFTSLDHGTTSGGVNTQLADDGSNAYRTAGLNLSLDGWWQIDATIQRAGQQNQLATFFSLLPDPNARGFDAAPKPESEPDAEALFDTAYAQMLTWERVRWTESLGTGNDVLVRARFAVVDGGESGDSAQSLDVVYSGGFAPNANGDPPRPPTFDSRSSVTIGDRGWVRTPGTEWLEGPPGSFSPPSGWDSIYDGSENFRMGITQTIDGAELQVVTFYLPEQTSQSEAWFAWWIDTGTGDVVRVAMIARSHYMSWNYTDINGDFTIDPPIPD